MFKKYFFCLKIIILIIRVCLEFRILNLDIVTVNYGKRGY
jgi:hypothetical protein